MTFPTAKSPTSSRAVKAEGDMPFDGKRMVYGDFQAMLDA
jgi:uncharacterized protein YbaA (DUF1428 family)